MKTTNNKLLDNTGNPVSHNRPREADLQAHTTIAQFLIDEGWTAGAAYLLSLEQYTNKLEKENQELKDNNEALAVEFNRLNEVLDKERQDQLLKVVESVLIEHELWPTDREYIDNDCKCSKIYFNDYSDGVKHLLQEIRKAIETK